MSDSPNLGLPFIEAAQAQKHVTHNEAIVRLDVLVQAAVSDMAAAHPPATPANGARVVVGASATGLFAGRDGQIAFYDEGAWRFLSPVDGWIVWSAADACVFAFASGSWVKLADTLKVLQNMERVGVGAAADAANPLSVRAANALFTASYAADGGDGSLRFKLNKENAAATVSQLYQSNWSGRAETGLCGDDSWSVRRSDDGINWTTALVVDPAQVAAPAGAPTRPGIAFLGDVDTGLHRPSDNTLCFVTGGVERMRVDSTGLQSAADGRFRRPADHWANAAYYSVGASLGGLSTEGSNAVFLTSNGYRNNTGTWTRYGASGQLGAAQVHLNPTGFISLSTDGDKPSGSSVNPTERMRIRPDGGVAIGGTGAATVGLYFQRNITGGTTAYGLRQVQTVQPDVTGAAYANQIVIGATDSGSPYTLGTLRYYHAMQGAFSAGSAVQAQSAFYVDANVAGATSNYGFHGAIPAGAGRWNAYMSGSAPNYFAGSVGIGSGMTSPSTTLHVNGPIRCGSYTRTTLPAAATVGEGSMAWVTNPASGVARAFWSNGTDWRDQANVAA